MVTNTRLTTSRRRWHLINFTTALLLGVSVLALGGCDETTPTGEGMPINVTGADFEAKVLDAPMPALVDFWAPWCRPCQLMQPALDRLSERFRGRVVIARVNTDKRRNRELAQRYKVRPIPHLIILKDGEVVDKWVGFGPDTEEELAAALTKALED